MFLPPPANVEPTISPIVVVDVSLVDGVFLANDVILVFNKPAEEIPTSKEDTFPGQHEATTTIGEPSLDQQGTLTNNISPKGPLPGVEDVLDIPSDEPCGDTEQPKDAANEGQGNVNEKTATTDVDSIVFTNQQFKDVQKNFLLKKKRYTRCTHLDTFEQEIIKIFLNCWTDS